MSYFFLCAFKIISLSLTFNIFSMIIFVFMLIRVISVSLKSRFIFSFSFHLGKLPQLFLQIYFLLLYLSPLLLVLPSFLCLLFQKLRGMSLFLFCSLGCIISPNLPSSLLIHFCQFKCTDPINFQFNYLSYFSTSEFWFF